jgi:hypothetical protein
MDNGQVDPSEAQARNGTVAPDTPECGAFPSTFPRTAPVIVIVLEVP